MKTIKDFEIGIILSTSDGYVKVKKCVHGVKYYANYQFDDEFETPEIENGEDVIDLDVDTISNCCG